jgi:hypothetical protein
MFRWLKDRTQATRAESAAVLPIAPTMVIEPAVDDGLVSISFRKFVDESPSPQMALDIFKDRWASSLPDLGAPLIAGGAALFTKDLRPRQAAQIFGKGTERLDGFRVIELGPLEGGHTYQLEGLGAQVIAIEGNAEAYLKCLIIKEIFDLKSKFLLGDFIKYLQGPDTQCDMLFASGVLYHMVEPLKLIELICKASARSFLWTHYYDAERSLGYQSKSVTHAGFTAEHFGKPYSDQSDGKFWGGMADSACWLARDDIIGAFAAFGHGQHQVVETNLDHPHGPCFTVATWR